MIPLRTVTDIVGSTVASTAQFCAREVLKRCEQVRTSRTVGQFVVDSGVAALRNRFAAPAAPATASAPPTSHDTPAPAAGTPSAAPPTADYDLLTSAQVVELIDTVDPASTQALLDYEMAHRRRRLVVEAAQRRLAT